MQHELSSSRSYLIRAINEWIIDNGLTPQLLLNASFPGIVVPVQFVQDDRIVLNISVSAAHGLNLGNEQITFSARFNGKPHTIQIPVNAVLAIYARENGKGMVFQDDEIAGASPPDVAATGLKKPVLTVIK